MMLMASLMASQMQTTSQKINSSLILLSAITEVKVAGQNKGNFSQFEFDWRDSIYCF